MSDLVKDVAQTGVNEVIDVAAMAVNAAIQTLRTLKNVTADLAAGGVRLSNNVLDDLIEELEQQNRHLEANLRTLADNLTDPLKELP